MTDVQRPEIVPVPGTATPTVDTDDRFVVTFLAILLGIFIVGSIVYIAKSSNPELFKTIARCALGVTVFSALVCYVVSVIRFSDHRSQGENRPIIVGLVLLIIFLTVNLIFILATEFMDKPARGTFLAAVTMYVDFGGYLALALAFLALDWLIVSRSQQNVVERDLLRLVDFPAFFGFLIIMVMWILAWRRQDEGLLNVSRYFIAGAHTFQLVASNATFILLLIHHKTRYQAHSAAANKVEVKPG